MRPGGLSTLCRSSSPRGEGAGRGGRQRAQSRACAGAQGCESSWQAHRRALLRSCAVWLKREQDRLRRPGFRCFLLLTVRSPASDCRDSAYSSLSYSNRLAEPRPACTQVRGRLLAPFLQRVLDRSSFPRTQPQPRLGRPRARHAALPAARRSPRTRPRPAPPPALLVVDHLPRTHLSPHPLERLPPSQHRLPPLEQQHRRRPVAAPPAASQRVAEPAVLHAGRRPARRISRREGLPRRFERPAARRARAVGRPARRRGGRAPVEVERVGQ